MFLKVLTSVVDGHVHHFVHHLGRRRRDRHRHGHGDVLDVSDGVVMRPIGHLHTGRGDGKCMENANQTYE